MEAVTASELVRHFGAWRDRAMAKPVYIHHHGRPKLVLTSVDFMEHLVATTGGTRDEGHDNLATLLEMIDTLVIITDERSCLVGVSPSARHLLGRPDWRGKKLEDFLPDDIRPILMRAVDSARDTGITERLQIRIGVRGERRIDLAVHPFDKGACLVGQDLSQAEGQLQAAARSQALDDMLAVLGNVAWLRINLRGYVIEASGSFDRMSGLSSAAYRSVRLPTLFDIPTRVGVADALEQAIDTMRTHSAQARLVTRDGRSLPVQIALSGEMLRVSGDTVMAMVAQTFPN